MMDTRTNIMNILAKEDEFVNVVIGQKQMSIDDDSDPLRFTMAGDYAQIQAFYATSKDEKNKYYKEAFEDYSKGIAYDGLSLVRLAQMYESGLYVEKNVDKALELYNEAITADLGQEGFSKMEIDEQAYFCRGLCYYHELGDSSMAKIQFEECKKINMGLLMFSMQSQNNVGYSTQMSFYCDIDAYLLLCEGQYEKVIGSLKNYACVGNLFYDDIGHFAESATRYNQLITLGYNFLISCDQDKLDENNWQELLETYTYSYAYICISDKEYSKALSILSKVDMPEAYSAIAYAHFSRYQQVGDKMDLEDACINYQKAAESDNISALTMLGNFYLFGWGIEKDKNKAKDCYQKAIANYNSLHCSYLEGEQKDINPLQDIIKESYLLAAVLYLLCDFSEEDEKIFECIAAANPTLHKLCDWLIKDYKKSRADLVLCYFDWIYKNSSAIDALINSKDFTEEFCDLLKSLGYNLYQSTAKRTTTANYGVCPAHPVDRQECRRQFILYNLEANGLYGQNKVDTEDEYDEKLNAFDDSIREVLVLDEYTPDIVRYFDKDVYQKLSSETKKSLVSAVNVWNAFKEFDDDDFDFSQVVHGVFKALEIECKKVFDKAFVKYLLQKFIQDNPDRNEYITVKNKKIVLGKELGNSIYEFWPETFLTKKKKEFVYAVDNTIDSNITFAQCIKIFSANDELTKKQLYEYLNTIGSSEFKNIPYCGFINKSGTFSRFKQRAENLAHLRNAKVHGGECSKEEALDTLKVMLGNSVYNSGQVLNDNTGILMEMYTRIDINEVLKLLDE